MDANEFFEIRIIEKDDGENTDQAQTDEAVAKSVQILPLCGRLKFSINTSSVVDCGVPTEKSKEANLEQQEEILVCGDVANEEPLPLIQHEAQERQSFEQNVCIGVVQESESLSHTQPLQYPSDLLHENIMQEVSDDEAESNNFEMINEEKPFTKESVIEERTIVNTNKVSYSCKTCNVELSCPLDYAHHMKIHFVDQIRQTKCYKDQFKCPICGKQLKNLNGVRKHQERHIEAKQPVNKPFKCEFCWKSFRSNSDLRKHLRVAHDDPEPYKCKTCGKGFSYVPDLRKHNLSHKTNLTFPCKLCKKVFTAKRHLTIHMSRHAHSCTVCSKEFASESDLQEHAAVHIVSPEEIAEKPHQCKHCFKRFRLESSLLNHVEVHADGQTVAHDQQNATSLLMLSPTRVIEAKDETQGSSIEVFNEASVANAGGTSVTVQSDTKIGMDGACDGSSSSTKGKYQGKERKRRTKDGQKKSMKVCNKVQKTDIVGTSTADQNVPKIGVMESCEGPRTERQNQDILTTDVVDKTDDKLNHNGNLKEENEFEFFGRVDIVISCDNCNQNFQNLTCYEDHMNSCEKSLGMARPEKNCYNSKPDPVKDHQSDIKTDSDSKPFGCEVCLKRFRLESSLKNHFEIHTQFELSNIPKPKKPRRTTEGGSGKKSQNRRGPRKKTK